MRALITGSNGFLGTWLTRRLVGRGDEVRCLVRKGSDTWGLDGLKVEVIQGDVTDAQTLLPAMKGIDVVFHLAGVRRAPGREAFFEVNSEGTRNVCDAMAASGEPKRLVLCGSLAASGPSNPERPRLEEDPFSPEEWYGQSKAEAERIAFSYSDRFQVTAARPSRILGPGDRENLVFFKMVKQGVRLKIGGGPRPLSMVDVDDVVELLLLMAERPEAVGEAFFAAGATTTIEQMQDTIAFALGVSVRTLFIPPPVLRGLGHAADFASRLTGRHLPLNRKLARQLLAPAWTCSTAKAERLLGYRPATGIDDSLKRSAAWYQQRGWI
ncbi:MAG: NAD-dependent epimerase/dehydratase family protein [Myxococcaceae bacterium]